jgi:hypothetical protein
MRQQMQMQMQTRRLRSRLHRSLHCRGRGRQLPHQSLAPVL